ncbi:MAG TPA: glycosyltransferase [Phycisphaerales bacterium]|nr:glycosyltransferase [Phycisphaerales bacterium]
MRILMLGWEFPPFIAGGLGVACYGLTKALDKLGHEVVFILPKPVDRSHSSHVKMLSPKALVTGGRAFSPQQGSSSSDSDAVQMLDEEGNPLPGLEHVTFKGVPASFSSPYPGFDAEAFARQIAGGTQEFLAGVHESYAGMEDATGAAAVADAASGTAVEHAPAPRASGHIGMGGGAGEGYGSDLFGDAERYARLVVAITRRERYDVIHAHDWLTFPAGIALAQVSGKPLVVHVHSTEFDRAGNNVNQRVYDIERAGMHAADRVVAVSQFTKSICVRRYAVAPDKIDVVYNGVDRDSVQPREGDKIEAGDKIVLFLGRITMQKGPEYFIAAAKRVLEKYENVKFVLAGSGDMALRMIDLAASMGIGHKVLFTGFLRGRDVDRVFKMADCYVMPSVSEPFGISALEAISHDVPVILSKTSGASEVLTHVLKVDFWDIDEMANKILAVLRFPPLSETLREHGAFELHRLTWEGAAERCVESYRVALAKRAPALV